MITSAPTMSAFHSARRVPLNLSTQGEMNSQTPATIAVTAARGQPQSGKGSQGRCRDADAFLKHIRQ
jgi:hypothetical protein